MDFEAGLAWIPFTLKVEVLENGKVPERAHKTDTGWDVFSRSEIVLIPGKVTKVPLGIIAEPPQGYWLDIRPRSGKTLQGIIVYPGTVDQEYRGEICALAQNQTCETVVIKPGEKIAQMVIQKRHDFPIQLCILDRDTARGEKGFGSSGV